MKKYIFTILAVAVIGTVVFININFNQNNHNVFPEANIQELVGKVETGEQTIVYYGSETCSSCTKFAPTLKKQFNDAKLKVIYVNADNTVYSEFVKSHNLNTTPTLVVFSKGKETARYVGTNATNGTNVYDGMVALYNSAANQ